MMKMVSCPQWAMLTVFLILGLPAGVALGADLNSSGPGTGGARPPHLFTLEDFPSIRQGVREVPRTLLPAILSAMGASSDPEGGPPNAPLEFDLRLATPESLDTPWLPGETRLLQLLARSSSSRLVRTPPRIDLLLVGPPGGLWLEGSPFTVGVDPIAWVVPDRPPGLYRFHVFDSSTGMSTTSDFTFEIGSIEVEIPTPTPTETLPPTPTPTETPVYIPPTETPTPTPTEAPLAVWDWSEM